jgi:signal transduction histidine kinase
MSTSQNLTFAKSSIEPSKDSLKPWRILIVDDDQEVHTMTKLSLHSFLYNDEKLEFISVYSAEEAKILLENDSNFALIILDIVMERQDAGLEVIEYIRKILNNSLIRIVIRTGEPGEVPERWIIEHYDINDYKEKTELTKDRLFTTIRNALAQYAQLEDLIFQRESLELFNHQLESIVSEALAKQKEQQEVLYRQNRLATMGELLSMIAHQWRQPLGTVSNMISNMQVDIELDTVDKNDQQYQLEKMSTFIQHLSTTIDDFKNLYQRKELKKEIPLKQMAESAITLLEESFKRHHVDLRLEIDDETDEYTACREIVQVFLNLLKNSHDQFIGKSVNDAKIIFRMKKENDSVIITIEDNAGGIDETIINNIFDPYFSTKEEKNGTGLGLYISKSIVENHCAGTLQVSNQEKGALFTLTLNNW